MANLPALPFTAANGVWSPNVHNAYTVMADIHKHTLQALQQELDAPRIRIHIETLTEHAVPILLALEESVKDEGIPTPWLQECALSMGNLLAQLQNTEVTADGCKSQFF